MIAADLSGVEVWVATTPVDMRKSFDGLAEVVRSFLGRDPQSGHLFVFRNKSAQRVKVLWWDRDGLAIYYKRLERGAFQFPRSNTTAVEINPYTVYDYTPSRSRDGPAKWLAGYSGYLQADAYGGYHRIYTGGLVRQVLCWAHARRKFYEARAVQPAEAHAALAYFVRLYASEEELGALRYTIST